MGDRVNYYARVVWSANKPGDFSYFISTSIIYIVSGKIFLLSSLLWERNPVQLNSRLLSEIGQRVCVYVLLEFAIGLFWKMLSFCSSVNLRFSPIFFSCGAALIAGTSTFPSKLTGWGMPSSCKKSLLWGLKQNTYTFLFSSHPFHIFFW